MELKHKEFVQKFETFHSIKCHMENYDAIRNDKHYWFTVYQYAYSTWVPQAREGAVILHLPESNQIYLFGGVAQEPMNGMAKLMLFGNTDCKWDIVFPHYKTDQSKIKGRYGFHGTYYNGKLYFFFGCQVFDKMRKERTCLNQIVIYDPFHNDIEMKYPFHEPDRFLTPRKYFAGFLLDNYYYIHGGIDTSGSILNSFIRINLDNLQWSDVLIPSVSDRKKKVPPMGQDGFTNYCYGHKLCVVTYGRS